MRCWILLLLSVLALTGRCYGDDDVLLPVITEPKPFDYAALPDISTDEVEDAFSQADIEASNRAALEKNLKAKGETIPSGPFSAAARHQRFTAIDPFSMDIDENQELFEGASEYLGKNEELSRDQKRFGLSTLDLTKGGPKTRSAVLRCQKMFGTSPCDSNNKFRTADGSCNNLNNPMWGKSFTCFARLVAPDYADGLSSPRVAASGANLPNPRVISRLIHDDIDVPAVNYTLMTMQWGQFMDHDMSLTPMTRARAGSSMEMIECCPQTAGSTPNHPECFPIQIPSNDGFYSTFGKTCINFVRSATCNSDCKLGPRQQTNQLTGIIDGSQVYGSDANAANALRTFQGGLLLAQDTNEGELLPKSQDPNNDQCSRPSTLGVCFQAGDGRVNEQPALTSMHTIWLRQHNRIARFFANNIPGATDEQIYQETRRIVAALIQHITYNEFLSVVLGPAYMNYFKLTPQTRYYTTYKSSTQPSIVHEFSTAAFRFGHSLIQNFFATFKNNVKDDNGLSLQDNYFFPFSLYGGSLDSIVHGLYAKPSQLFDRHFVEAVTNHLYRPREDKFGLDLVALNTQRGRDHGVSGYTTYVNYCFNYNVKRFRDLLKFMTLENVKKLAAVYKSVDDIDLFSGGISEKPLPGGVVGPTFGCIIGLQFNHLKYGDRFFYEHSGQAGSFTQAQLQAIRRIKLSTILCKNSDRIVKIANYVFKPTDPNSYVPCSGLPDLDLSLWQNG